MFLFCFAVTGAGSSPMLGWISFFIFSLLVFSLSPLPSLVLRISTCSPTYALWPANYDDFCRYMYVEDVINIISTRT